MKTILQNLMAVIMLLAALFQIHAQSTLIYDQQSATGPTSPPANDFLHIQEDSPLMQSFIPSLSAIGFVEFQFWDISGNGNNGATVYVNLWTGSPDTSSATLLGSTAPVYMPNGFVNDGLGYAGVADFYFPTPVALTSGQTYYLEPVVLSGDDPWDIAILANTNTYPNGQLYGGSGGFTSPFQPPTDFWFREGIVAAPEPTTLALVGLSGLLVFGFKRHSKLLALLLFVIPVVSVHAADSVVQATADQAGLSRVSGTTLSGGNGTFWVMTTGSNGQLDELPYPFLPPKLSTLPIYSVLDNYYIIDDTGSSLLPVSLGKVSSLQAASTAQAQAESVMNLIELIEGSSTSNNNGVHAMDTDLSPPGGDTNSGGGSLPSISYSPLNTNGLWIEASNEIAYIGLRLHNTINGNYFICCQLIYELCQ